MKYEYYDLPDNKKTAQWRGRRQMRDVGEKYIR